MSWYTIFDQQEALITSTTTAATPVSTDLLLVHNQATGKKFATTAAAVVQAGMFGAVTTATSNSTATNIIPTGVTILKSTGGSSTQWLLTDPTAVGQVKQLIFLSSTTSTLYAVQTVAASIQCTGGSSANLMNFASTATGAYVNWGQGVTMVSLTTTSWIITEVNRNPTAVTSGVLFAVGSGPIFTSV